MKIKKDNFAQRKMELFTVQGMEKFLSLVTYCAVSAGVFAGSAGLMFCYFLSVRFYRKGMHIIGIMRSVINITFFVGSIFLVICLLLYRNLKRCKTEWEVSQEAEEYYRKSVFTGKGRIMVSAFFGVCNIVFMHFIPYFSTLEEMDIVFYAGSVIVVFSAFFTLFFLIKWKIFTKITIHRTIKESGIENFDCGVQKKRSLIKWIIYWGIVFTVYLAVSVYYQNFQMYAPLPILASLNFILRFVINNPFRRYAGLSAKRVTTHILNICSTILIIWFYFFIIENGSDYNKSYIDDLDYSGFAHTSDIAYDRETGVYTVRGKNEEFRILQLTDTHICASITTIEMDRKAFDACYALIKEAQPNLIIVTGDLVFPIPLHTFSNDNLTAIGQFCSFMDHIGIPWAMVYGNHDTEMVAKYSARELTGLYRYYADEANSVMLYAYHQPNVYGRYNQYLRIENSDHTLNRIIFLVDSNDYVKGAGKINEYDSVHPDQIQWYEGVIDQVYVEEGRRIPSFVFMHIPFKAFADAQEALKSSSPDAVYLFGENKEGVCHPDFDSGFFDAIQRKGSTQAVFVGHDHLNNMAVRYKGVDLVYSKSIDYIAYPGIARKTAQRGATLIILLQDGTYHIEQLHYTK